MIFIPTTSLVIISICLFLLGFILGWYIKHYLLTKRLLNYIRYLENQFMEDNNYDTNRQSDSGRDEKR